MSVKGISIGLAASVVIAVGMPGYANAGSHCAPSGLGYSAPRMVGYKPAYVQGRLTAVKPVAAEPALAIAPVAVQGGGEAEARPAAAVVKKGALAPKPGALRDAALPSTVAQPASLAETPEAATVSGIAARLAALAAQQAADARGKRAAIE